MKIKPIDINKLYSKGFCSSRLTPVQTKILSRYTEDLIFNEAENKNKNFQLFKIELIDIRPSISMVIDDILLWAKPLTDMFLDEFDKKRDVEVSILRLSGEQCFEMENEEKKHTVLSILLPVTYVDDAEIEHDTPDIEISPCLVSGECGKNYFISYSTGLMIAMSNGLPVFNKKITIKSEKEEFYSYLIIKIGA